MDLSVVVPTLNARERLSECLDALADQPRGAVGRRAVDDDDLRLGRRLEEAFGDVGSAGGHDYMAGGQIPLGLIADAETGGDAVVERTVRCRLFDALGEWAGE